MGGYGSGGYRYNARRSVESLLRLDVRRLHRAGLLTPNTPGISTWRRGESVTSSISYRTTGTLEGRASALELDYSRKGAPVKQHLPLEWTPCNYGGSRPWLLCPGCSRRVAILYGAPFYCRHCHDLAYESSRESASDRGIRKAQAIRERLRGSANMSLPFPPKPKGMHWETYYRLEDEANVAYYRAMLDLAIRLNGVLRRR